MRDGGGGEGGARSRRESASETDVCSGTYCRGNHVSSGLAKAPLSLNESEEAASPEN